MLFNPFKFGGNFIQNGYFDHTLNFHKFHQEPLKWNVERKTGVRPTEKPLVARERTNNKLNPHTASMPGFEHGLHWWEANALTTVTPLLPKRTQWAIAFNTPISIKVASEKNDA